MLFAGTAIDVGALRKRDYSVVIHFFWIVIPAQAGIQSKHHSILCSPLPLWQDSTAKPLPGSHP